MMSNICQCNDATFAGTLVSLKCSRFRIRLMSGNKVCYERPHTVLQSIILQVCVNKHIRIAMQKS